MRRTVRLSAALIGLLGLSPDSYDPGDLKRRSAPGSGKSDERQRGGRRCRRKPYSES